MKGGNTMLRKDFKTAVEVVWRSLLPARTSQEREIKG